MFVRRDGVNQVKTGSPPSWLFCGNNVFNFLGKKLAASVRLDVELTPEIVESGQLDVLDHLALAHDEAPQVLRALIQR